MFGVYFDKCCCVFTDVEVISLLVAKKRKEDNDEYFTHFRPTILSEGSKEFATNHAFPSRFLLTLTVHDSIMYVTS